MTWSVVLVRPEFMLEQNYLFLFITSSISFFNKVGGLYSSSQTSQRYVNSVTKEIELISDTIFAEPSQTYQIRFPVKDINVRVQNLTTVNFS